MSPLGVWCVCVCFVVCVCPVSPSLVRLATSLNQYTCGSIDSANKLTFSKAFSSAGMHHPSTASLLRALDAGRVDLATSLTSGEARASKANALRYLPLIRRLLMSCEVQPDTAVLDERLSFMWRGALEGDGPGGERGKVRSSQALMYEVTMAVASAAVACAALGCEASQRGDFVEATKSFKEAADIMNHLHSEHLPQWVSLGSTSASSDLPIECTAGGCKAYESIFRAHAQQMAVAKALEGATVNYSLSAKLCAGVKEQVEDFVRVLRSEGAVHYCRLPASYLKYVAFQTALQDSLSLYFVSRSSWSKGQYGLALAQLYSARSLLSVRASVTSPGIPEDVESSRSALHVLLPDLNSLRSHCDALASSWKRDVDTVYFDKIPETVPTSSRPKGVKMVKVDRWRHAEPGDLEPAPLSVKAPDPPPGGGGEEEGRPPPTAPKEDMTDEEMARELQRRLNAGEDV